MLCLFRILSTAVSVTIQATLIAPFVVFFGYGRRGPSRHACASPILHSPSLLFLVNVYFFTFADACKTKRLSPGESRSLPPLTPCFPGGRTEAIARRFG